MDFGLFLLALGAVGWVGSGLSNRIESLRKDLSTSTENARFLHMEINTLHNRLKHLEKDYINRLDKGTAP